MTRACWKRNGATAAGNTVTVVNNAGAAGASTASDGIMVVLALNGATTSAGAFALNGRVAAGAYEYFCSRAVYQPIRPRSGVCAPHSLPAEYCNRGGASSRSTENRTFAASSRTASGHSAGGSGRAKSGR
ncbi:MAG: hypothetical protein ACODTL_01540 [Brucella sp.]